MLRALWHLLLRGDEDDVPVMDRAWYREVLDEPDPERQLRLNARNARAVKAAHRGALLDVIRHAAPLDAEIAALWSRIQSDFYDNQRAIVQSLDDQGGAAAGPRRRRGRPTSSGRSTTPTCGSCSSAERGWTPEQWEQWFADTTLRAAARAEQRRRKRFLKSLTSRAPASATLAA